MAGYIFGGDTPWTYEQLQRRRQIADSMLASLGTPRNVGEGLAEVGKALAIRGMNKRADTRDAELKGEFDQKWSSMFGGGAPATPSMSYTPPDPNSPQGIADDTMRALGKQPMAPEGWDAIKQGIFTGESGGDYNALFGYSNRPGGAFAGTKLTDMTVDQALAFADPSGPYAQHVKGQIGRVATPMGAYQVVGTTLRAAKDGLGLTGSEPMTPELQDRIGQWIYKTQGTGAWEGYKGPRSGGGSPATPMDIGALADIAGSPYATPGQKAVVNAILQQQMNSYDPMYNMGLEKARLELDALRNPKPKSEGFTLSPGQQRFDAQGNAIASVSPAAAPRPMTADERAQWGIPPEDKRAYAMTEKGPQVIGGAGVTVNNNIGGEKKYDETLGKSLADKYIAIQDGAQQAQSKIATLDGLSQALAQTSYTGWGADTLLGVKRAAKSLGLDVGEDLGPEETARALGNQLALQLRSPSNGAGMPGAMSDKDREFLVASVPGLGKTPEGNRRLIDYMMRVEQRNIDVAKFANQYAQDHGGRIDNDFFTALADWSEKNPLFPEADSPAQTPQNTMSGGVKWKVVE